MRSSSISCSRGPAAFLVILLSVLAIGIGIAEWALRGFVDSDDNANILARRVAAIYERRNWPVLGDSSLGNVLVGDSQMYAGFHDHRDFFQLALSGETAPMLNILVQEYFRFRR